MIRTLTLTLAILCSSTAFAQVDEQEGLTQAILDLTTTPRRHLFWKPCGERMRGDSSEAHAAASEIATAILREAGSDLNPFLMAAQMMHESGMNPCAFSNRESAEYSRSLGRRPNRTDILRLLRSSALREEHDIRAMDSGLAQFRWPGVVARNLGIESAEELLDIDTSIRIFASALRLYKTHCVETPVFHITQSEDRPDGRVRVRHFEYSCSDHYWAIHNSGSAGSVRQQYIHNILRRYEIVEPWERRVTQAVSSSNG